MLPTGGARPVAGAPPGVQVAPAAPAPPQPFTPAQLTVLRSQILAFRRLKRGDKALPAEVIAGIKPPPLPSPGNRALPSVTAPSTLPPPSAHAPAQPPGPTGLSHAPVNAIAPPVPTAISHALPTAVSHALPTAVSHALPSVAKPPAVPGAGPGVSMIAPVQVPKEPTPPPQPPLLHRERGPMYALASGPRTGAWQPRPAGPTHLPSLQLGYDIAQLMANELAAAVRRKMLARLHHLEAVLSGATGQTPSLAERSRLKLEVRALHSIDRQRKLRAAIERHQEEIMTMNDRTYRKFARTAGRQRLDRFKVEEKARIELAAERARTIKAWRAELQEKGVISRELRIARNRHVSRAHDRLAREHNKAKDDDRTKRMEALKAHDWEAYQELLREQMGPETTTERYEVISKFLNDTEEYLHKLASKVASVRLSQEASEAAAIAVAEARARGMAEEDVMEAARSAAQEAVDLSDVVRGSRGGEDAQSRYYGLAHSVQEVVRSQPALLRPPGNARLREYQMVGLQWMVSLYNNHLNGILADEMGLGKTVQVMALIAYLMEHKNNYGPHLIIVPNAVIVNWKSELTQWLPSVRCVYYVGQKEERARKFATEVSSLQFNVLVTTYEYIMRDRTKLSKVEWKYIIIDEAQRMKDRQSKLAKDLDRFTAARRLLLTGTPLQNELKELWSLLNLLLPEVFDDKATFAEWFGDALGKQAGEGGPDEWLEKEKRVVVIHRLHQILEPFMLRRQVQDVESKLPEKVAVVVKVAMRPFQSVVYQWVKASGTIRVDPAAAIFGKQFRTYAPLNNKCMELRKVCNHPALSYPTTYKADPSDLIRHCGKFAVLDRLLVKLYASGHRVLLFSTMTRLLDLLEQYLRWRSVTGPDGQPTTMGYLRIDGSTALEDREIAIQKFNESNSNAFIFLLSIRAAGRGLNLQAADTVIIYDPDPNPKNEEQAIARSHRIGQTKEVRVIHLEAVADAAARSGNSVQAQAEEWSHPERRFADSIESLVRSNIQKMKIDMANEVIDAGRFDMQTTMEERKQTLEAMLQDEERMKKAVNVVPSNTELNAWVARSEAERQMFDRLDAELDWPAESKGLVDVPSFLYYTDQQLDEAVASTSKVKPGALAAANRAALAAAKAKLEAEALPQQATPVERDDVFDDPGAGLRDVPPAPGRMLPKIKLFRSGGALSTVSGSEMRTGSEMHTVSRMESEVSDSISIGGVDPGDMEEEDVDANGVIIDDMGTVIPTAELMQHASQALGPPSSRGTGIDASTGVPSHAPSDPGPNAATPKPQEHSSMRGSEGGPTQRAANARQDSAAATTPGYPRGVPDARDSGVGDPSPLPHSPYQGGGVGPGPLGQVSLDAPPPARASPVPQRPPKLSIKLKRKAPDASPARSSQGTGQAAGDGHHHKHPRHVEGHAGETRSAGTHADGADARQGTTAEAGRSYSHLQAPADGTQGQSRGAGHPSGPPCSGHLAVADLPGAQPPPPLPVKAPLKLKVKFKMPRPPE